MGALIKADAAGSMREQGQYLTFTLNEEVYGVGILCVKEIIEYGHLTVVPMMPECTRGVINLRGAVVPVVDLASRFGRPPTAIGRRSCIVIVEVAAETERQVVGIIVDAVNEVLDISSGSIEPPPSFGVRIRTEFISGMAKVEGGFIVLLDIARVLSLDELAAIPQLPEAFAEPAAAC
jgi:purine-binding chemotaxis protein CheW